MSRLYNMEIVARGIDPAKSADVDQAIYTIWGGELYIDEPTERGWTGENTLGGGMREEEFAEQAARAIFAANGAPCEVSVVATYLEDLPYEQFEFGPDDYERIVA